MGLGKVQWRRHNWISLKSFIENSKTGDVFSSDSGWDTLNNRKEWIVFKNEKINNEIYEIIPDGSTLCGNHVFNWEWVSTSSEVINEV